MQRELGGGFSGIIDEVRVYDKALTPEVIGTILSSRQAPQHLVLVCAGRYGGALWGWMVPLLTRLSHSGQVYGSSTEAFATEIFRAFGSLQTNGARARAGRSRGSRLTGARNSFAPCCISCYLLPREYRCQ